MTRRILPVILAFYVLLAVTYSFVTPLWEAPDEPSHYLYIEHLATHGELPPPTPPQRGRFFEHGYVTSLYEWYQLPLYYALLAPAIAFLEVLQPDTIPQQLPVVNPKFQEGAPNLFHPVPNRSLRSLLTSPGPRIARLASVLFGLLTLMVTYLLALTITGGDEPTALTATGFMAFIPQFTFLTSYISNDNGANLLSSLCFLAYLTWFRLTPAPSRGQLVSAGLLASLALLTKLSLLFVLPLGLLCLLQRLAHHRTLTLWMRESVIFAGVAISLPLAGVLFLPGFRSQLAHAQVALRVKPELVSFQAITRLWSPTHTSFWGRFGWMNIPTPEWITDTLTLIAFIGLIGSCALFWQANKQAQGAWVSRRSIGLLWMICSLVVLGFIRFNLSVHQPQGRLLFPALSAFVILIVLGLFRLGGYRHRQVVGLGLIGFAFLSNLVSLFATLVSAYVVSAS